MSGIGEKLKKLRDERNYTQKEISSILGIAQNTYSGYETNKHIPDLEILIKIADLYKTSVDYIIGRYN